MPNESKHADELRKLGFKEMPNITSSRTEKAKSPPSFTASDMFTFATDETGQTWGAVGTHDLTSLGFNNTSLQVRSILEQMDMKPKPN